jgi:opacity protein-like surface antigen
MITISRISLILASCIVPAIAGTPSAPAETSPITMPETSEWQVRTALYGWAQGLNGDVGVKGFTAPIDLGFDDILENLDIAVMGLVEINRGRWGLLADFNYAKISDDITTGSGIVDFEQKQFLGNFFVTYEVHQCESLKFDVYGGVRVNWLEVSLDLPPNSRSADKAWVDPVIGARLQSDLGQAFFVRAVCDIGGFGAASDLTWQAMLGLGYHVTENANLLVGYRAIGTDYTSGGFTYDVIAHGLLLGYEYTF